RLPYFLHCDQSDRLPAKADPCKPRHSRPQHAIRILDDDFDRINPLAILVARALGPDLRDAAGEGAAPHRLQLEPHRAVKFHLGNVALVDVYLEQELFELTDSANLLASAEVASDRLAQIIAQNDSGAGRQHTHTVVFSLQNLSPLSQRAQLLPVRVQLGYQGLKIRTGGPSFGLCHKLVGLGAVDQPVVIDESGIEPGKCLLQLLLIHPGGVYRSVVLDRSDKPLFVELPIALDLVAVVIELGLFELNIGLQYR